MDNSYILDLLENTAVSIIYDWENGYDIEGLCFYLNEDKDLLHGLFTYENAMKVSPLKRKGKYNTIIGKYSFWWPCGSRNDNFITYENCVEPRIKFIDWMIEQIKNEKS